MAVATCARDSMVTRVALRMFVTSKKVTYARCRVALYRELASVKVCKIRTDNDEYYRVVRYTNVNR